GHSHQSVSDIQSSFLQADPQRVGAMRGGEILCPQVPEICDPRTPEQLLGLSANDVTGLWWRGRHDGVYLLCLCKRCHGFQRKRSPTLRRVGICEPPLQPIDRLCMKKL